MDGVSTIDDTRAYRFLGNVLSTEDVELDCEHVMEVIARYVDVEIATGEAPRDGDGVPLHLKHCYHCEQMYQALHAIAEMEAEGSLPAVDGLWSELRAALGDDDPADAANGAPRQAHVASPSDPRSD